jgi:hypothetical protein
MTVAASRRSDVFSNCCGETRKSDRLGRALACR